MEVTTIKLLLTLAGAALCSSQRVTGVDHSANVKRRAAITWLTEPRAAVSATIEHSVLIIRLCDNDSNSIQPRQELQHFHNHVDESCCYQAHDSDELAHSVESCYCCCDTKQYALRQMANQALWHAAHCMSNNIIAVSMLPSRKGQ